MYVLNIRVVLGLAIGFLLAGHKKWNFFGKHKGIVKETIVCIIMIIIMIIISLGYVFVS